MVNDFLFELGCEELPSAAVLGLSEALSESIQTLLIKHGIVFKAIKSFAAPRRLALLITDVALQQPEQNNTRRGPAVTAAFDKDGNPTKALTGFASSCGVSIDQLTRQVSDKGEWLVYESRTAGARTADLLPQLINEAITGLPVAKPMRWGRNEFEFARPVHWLIMLLGNDVLPMKLFGVDSGQLTHGHRFHHPQSIKINHPSDYENRLEKAYVMADFEKRRALIRQQVSQLADKEQAQAIMPDNLLNEVTSIVEWPHALLAGFSERFLQVPQEALIASMQEHQKCFALKDKAGKLLPRFIAVANIDSTHNDQVIAGNEKVMQARLSDAAFFFEQDKKQPLAHLMEATGKVVFQAKLGTLHDKTDRMQLFMVYLADYYDVDKEHAKRSASLSKCDLLTGMVGEFPELQGLMGYYYALHDGEDETVARALYEQYLPRFSGDDIPETSLGTALSLADRIDTLVGIFMIGQKPTGVKDPFKLRRHALAIVRLLINSPKLLLTTLLQQALSNYNDRLQPLQSNIDEMSNFILDRLEGYYQTKNIAANIVLAVRNRQSEDLSDFDKRVHALAQFERQPEAAVLAAACKRVSNLLQQQSGVIQPVAVELLTENAEQALHQHMDKLQHHLDALYAQSDYEAILGSLATLREPVDAFFTDVMVMVDEERIRQNRLALVSRLQSMLQNVADISCLSLTA